MKNFNKKVFLGLFLIAGILGSCKKDDRDPVEPEVPTAERKGIYVLCEGLLHANNASLSYFNYEDRNLKKDRFSEVNGRELGDTGNDIQIYGSKMYIVVNVSSTLEIVNPQTGASIKKLDLKDNGIGRQPRYIVFNKNKAYISSYDGTVAVLDTASMAIEKYITVGRNPEQMVISNNKLYVANSGGLDYPDVDKTVSVVDLATETETKKITVGENPRKLFADAYGDIYVLSSEVYDFVNPANSTNASMTVINSQTDAVKAKADFSAGAVAVNGDFAYMTDSGGKIKVFNLKTDPMAGGSFVLEKNNFITDGTTITTPYGIAYDEINNELFVTDAKNYTSSGEVFCFDKEGKKKYSLTVGINPNNVVFINK